MLDVEATVISGRGMGKTEWWVVVWCGGEQTHNFEIATQLV